MRHTKRLAALLLPAALGLVALPAPAIEWTYAQVTVSPQTSSGLLPAVFKFTGKVTLKKGGRFTYRWERSDGLVDKTVNPAVSYDGVHPALVTTTWTLEAVGPCRPFRGWVRLHLLTPVDFVSNLADFRFECGTPVSDGPASNCSGKPDLVPLLHTPMDGWVGVRNRGTGDAGPSRLLIKCVREGPAGPGGVCPGLLASAIAPPFFSTPDGLLGLNVGAISCGKELSFPRVWFENTKWPSGTYRFTAIADAYNAVTESDEGNNKATSSLVR